MNCGLVRGILITLNEYGRIAEDCHIWLDSMSPHGK